MAERLKDRLLDTDRLADIVAGPDAYRDLPRLIDAVQVSRWCGVAIRWGVCCNCTVLRGFPAPFPDLWLRI